MSWPLAKLGELSQINAGNSAPQGQGDFSDTGTPFIRAGSLAQLLKGATDHLEAIDEADAKRLKLKLFPKDAILFAKSGMSCMKGYVYRLPFDAHVVSHLAIVQPGPELFPAYAEHALRVFSPVSLTKDESYPSIRLPEIANLEIPLPPLDEQKRIAGILDQADALRRLRAQALDKLNTLGQAIFHEMFGDPTANIKDLPVKSLGEVCSFISGGTPNKSNPLFWGGDFPWVSPKDMKKLRICDAEDHVTRQAFESTNLKIIEIDTPLIVVRGMILAHTVPLAITTTPVAINQDMKAIKFDDTVIPEFGLWCLKAQHDSILTKVDTAAHGTKRLDTEVLKTLPIFSLPKESQNDFIEKIYECDRQISRYRKQILEFEKIFSSLQHRAFRGEL